MDKKLILHHPNQMKKRNMFPPLILLTGLLLMVATTLQAKSASDAAAAAERPQVTIIRQQQSTIYEYRLGGELYMVRIEPKQGAPYFLIDSDHDGSLETRRNALEAPDIVQWRLFSW
ncbi:MAG: DUF2782 domain-containing protein [Gammaproteobacteria bacterium]|nr:DUF2782 domain-containing protein [Gammaproteobacteria bacterium]